MNERTTRLLGLLSLVAGLAGCDSGKVSPVDAVPRTYQASADVGDFTISVAIVQSHPILDEHEKRIKIWRGKKQIALFKLSDPGGFSTVYVVDQGPRLLVIDGLINGKLIDKMSGDAVEVKPDTVPSNFAEQNLGRFQFIDTPPGYRWVPHAL